MAGVPFEIKRDVGSTHPINIYFDPDLYFQVTVGDALRIANCIHYLSPLSLDIRASNCQLRLDIFSPSIFKMVDTDSRRIFRLSGNEALELSVLLFNAVGSVQSVSFTATQNSLSSGQANSKTFEIVEHLGAQNPICIYFYQKLYFDVNLQTARIIRDLLSAKIPANFDFDSAQGRGNVAISKSEQFNFLHKKNHMGIVLSKEDSHDLLVGLGRSIVNINAYNRKQSIANLPPAVPNPLSSGQPMNYKPCQNELLDVVFDSYGQYPLHVVVTIGGSQFSMHVQDAYVELLVRCLSVPGHNDSYIVGKGEHYKVSWLPLGNLKHIKIANRTTGFSIFLASGPAARLAVLIESKMPSRHKTTEEKSESEKSVDSIKKQTDDNLRSVFGG